MAKYNKMARAMKAGGAAAVGCAVGLGVVSIFWWRAGAGESWSGLLASAGLIGAVAGAFVGLAAYGSYLVIRLDEPY